MKPTSERLVGAVLFVVVSGCASPQADAGAPTVVFDACTLLPQDLAERALGTGVTRDGRSGGDVCMYSADPNGAVMVRLERTDLFESIPRGAVVDGVGDQSFVDRQGTMHVRKGALAFYLKIGTLRDQHASTAPTPNRMHAKELALAIVDKL